MRDKFTLSGGQSAKLEIAIDRNYGSTVDVEWLCSGENFKQVSSLARGEAELIIKPRPTLTISTPPDLSLTASTFLAWLEAREKLHFFLTGEEVHIKDMFVVDEATLARTDIMPVFRPAGATNRMALDWKVKLGMKPSYEEVDVMKYKGANGPKVPELYYINRSIRPDENTLGDDAQSPDQLIAVPNITWTNLYGWSDVDNLHFLITGKHLDSEGTWTWFPNDRLPGDGKVAFGYWYSGYDEADFYWGYRYGRNSNIGARVAIPLLLKPS